MNAPYLDLQLNSCAEAASTNQTGCLILHSSASRLFFNGKNILLEESGNSCPLHWLRAIPLLLELTWFVNHSHNESTFFQITFHKFKVSFTLPRLEALALSQTFSLRHFLVKVVLLPLGASVNTLDAFFWWCSQSQITVAVRGWNLDHVSHSGNQMQWMQTRRRTHTHADIVKTISSFSRLMPTILQKLCTSAVGSDGSGVWFKVNGAEITVNSYCMFSTTYRKWFQCTQRTHIHTFYNILELLCFCTQLCTLCCWWPLHNLYKLSAASSSRMPVFLVKNHSAHLRSSVMQLPSWAGLVPTGFF